MAVARPIRLLGAASILLVLFLIFQLRKSAAPLVATFGSGDKLTDKLTHGMTKDPLLDRTLQQNFAMIAGVELTISSNGGAGRYFMACGGQRLRAGQ